MRSKEEIELKRDLHLERAREMKERAAGWIGIMTWKYEHLIEVADWHRNQAAALDWVLEEEKGE